MAEVHQNSKRELPDQLVKLLKMDVEFSKKLFDHFDRKYGFTNYHQWLVYLEYSCHGLVWIGGVFASLYLLPSWMELWSNLLLLIFLDIVVVAVVKAFTRRRRPGYNRGKMFVTVGPDKFSFPSGHATRAVALALFFGIQHPPVHSVVALPAFAAWAVAVCLSRVLLGRHHILDVGGGIAIGALEHSVASSLAIGPDAAEGLRQYMFDDDPWSSA